jgi:hypothetical protein
MSQKHERPIAPFADIHAEDGHVRVTLIHDPTVEGLDAALYLDSSGSMAEEYAYDKPVPGTGRRVASRGLLGWLFGKPKTEKVVDPEYTNEVEPQARRMLEFLAGKDRNGRLRVAYWSSDVRVLGEVDAATARELKFPGPADGGTNLAPAVRDYVAYLAAEAPKGARRGLMVVMTDGEIQDEASVKRELEGVASRVKQGALPPVTFLIVGVGEGVKEEQLERLAHEEYGGIDHLVCHKIAEEIDQVAEIASALVDETMIVAPSGVVYDEQMRVVARYDHGLPAVLEFALPEGHKNFTLEMNGRQYAQRVPDEEHHDEETEAAHE